MPESKDTTIARSRRRALLLAGIGSFLVYLIPLVHAHGGMLWGMVIWGNLSEGLGRKELSWIIAELVLALVYQGVACASLYWVISRRGLWRWLSVLVLALASIPLLFWVFFVVLPVRYLIEVDTASEQTDWPVVCRVEDAAVAAIETGPGFAAAGEVWLRLRGNDLAFSRLRMPGCSVDTIPTTFLASGGAIQRVAPGGALVFSTYDKESGSTQFWYLAQTGAEPVRLHPPPEGDYGPVLSRDGSQVAWLYWIRAASRAVLETRILLRDMQGEEDSDILLQIPEQTRIRLLDVDAATATLIVTHNSETVWAYGFDGKAKWGPVGAEGMSIHGVQTLHLVDGGRVIWDGYRDTPLRYRIDWSLRSGSDRYSVPKGRSITAVAVAPDSHFIAVSVTTALNIGNILDSIFVLDAVTGQEVYRRFLPSYTRSQLAFLGPHQLAISRYENGRTWVEVLAVPDS